MFRAPIALLCLILTPTVALGGPPGPECQRFEACCVGMGGAPAQCSSASYTEAQCAAANGDNYQACSPYWFAPGGATATSSGPAANPLGSECAAFEHCCHSRYGESPQCDASSYSEAQCAQANQANASWCSQYGPPPSAAPAPAPVAGPGAQCALFQQCCVATSGQGPQCDISSYTEAQCAAANQANADACAAVGVQMGPGPECTAFHACCVSMYGDTPQCDVSAYTETQCAQANAANASACPR